MSSVTRFLSQRDVALCMLKCCPTLIMHDARPDTHFIQVKLLRISEKHQPIRKIYLIVNSLISIERGIAGAGN